MEDMRIFFSEFFWVKMNNFIIGIIDNADFIFYSWSYLFDFIRCILGNTGDMFGKMMKSIYNRLLLNILYVINQKYGLNL